MRIQQLHLAAFGPFTDRSLDFDGVGLHIVYGRNEAGKSSALRGLKALLYGVDMNTADNFVHAYGKLRIGGWLRMLDGRELRFVRRKGRKDTLLTPADEVLDEQLLTPFLGGVNSQLFEMLFGIDHQALVQGGQEILEQRGEVGQALFSAALGSHALHAVLTQLDDEAKRLFLPAGSKPLINAAIRSHAKLKGEIKKCSLSSRQWDEQRQSFERTAQALEAIQSELFSRRIEVNRLQRIQRVLPKLAGRRELLQELESLGDPVALSEDFSKRRQQTVNRLETAQAMVGRAASALKGLRQELEGLSINRALLEQAEGIEDLHARLGGHRKAQQERPHLEAEHQQRLTDAAYMLKEIRPDLQLKEVGQLRFVAAMRQTISATGSQKAVLVSALKQVESNLVKTESRLQVIRQERADSPQSASSDALCRAIAAARKQGDLDAAVFSVQSELAASLAACADDLSRLILWDGPLEAVAGLALPNSENIDRFEALYDELRSHSRQLEREREQTAGKLQETQLKLDEIRRTGAVPTEADLVDSRSQRDGMWQLLRRHWIEGEDVSAEADRFQAEGGLPDAFEKSMVGADDLSDRLRREADRVAEMAGLQAREERGELQMAEIAGKIAASEVDKYRFDAEWKALWAPSGITPRTPREMRIWLNDFVQLRVRVVELNALRRKAAELEQMRNRHIEQLDRQLLELGKPASNTALLEPLLLECEAVARQLDESKQRQDMLDKEIRERQADVAALTEERRLATHALDAWKSQWGESMQRFGLGRDASPAEANDYIERVKALLVLNVEVEKLEIRIKANDREAAAFRSRVRGVSAAVAPELAGLAAHDAVVRLNWLLSENRLRETRWQQVQAQIEQAVQEINESNALIQSMTERLDSLCAEAKCASRDELEAAERKSAHYLGIRQSIVSLEQQILEMGEGATVVELEAESAGTDPDRLPGRIADLKNRIDNELEPKRTKLAESKGREERELELMDGSDRAAILADQAQAALAAIRTDAERYVQMKLAGRVLRDQIEYYRKQNQGPLVRRAGEHFATLTLGSFEGLMTDFNAKDESVLAGVRPGGGKVHVEAMSSGTRDQLYLALRLASLEKYMESSEPMPFIVDDVLVDFDDERSLAALGVLAALAAKTQVILFTHHSRVVEQAQQIHLPVPVQSL